MSLQVTGSNLLMRNLLPREPEDKILDGVGAGVFEFLSKEILLGAGLWTLESVSTVESSSAADSIGTRVPISVQRQIKSTQGL